MDGDEQILNRIQYIRARNNVLHVDVMRIALAARPAEAKELFRQILANDAQITRLTSELVRND